LQPSHSDSRGSLRINGAVLADPRWLLQPAAQLLLGSHAVAFAEAATIAAAPSDAAAGPIETEHRGDGSRTKATQSTSSAPVAPSPSPSPLTIVQRLASWMLGPKALQTSRAGERRPREFALSQQHNRTNASSELISLALVSAPTAPGPLRPLARGTDHVTLLTSVDTDSELHEKDADRTRALSETPSKRGASDGTATARTRRRGHCSTRCRSSSSGTHLTGSAVCVDPGTALVTFEALAATGVRYNPGSHKPLSHIYDRFAYADTSVDCAPEFLFERLCSALHSQCTVLPNEERLDLPDALHRLV
jgi:hypothetical protein